MIGGELVEAKPHIIIPYYIYNSSMGCVGQKYCGLILGLSSKYGFCTAKNDYFAKFFFVGDWEALSDVEKERKTDSAKKQINTIIKQNFVKNIGSGHHRKLVLSYIENESQKALTETGKKFPKDGETGKKFPETGKKFPLLPIIYNKYILKSKSELEPGQKTDSEILLELFDLFWSTYPRREKKKVAQSIFDKLKIDDLDLLLFILPQISVRYADTQKNYIPLPTTFLNGELWNDEYFEQKNSKNAKNFAKEGAVVSVSSEMEESVQRFRALSEGDAVELVMVDHEVLERLDMSGNDAVEMVQLYSLSKLRGKIATVWDDAVRGVA